MKLKSIIHDLRETTAEPDVRNRMMALKDLLNKTIDHLHGVFLPDVFVSICRGIWDRMGQVRDIITLQYITLNVFVFRLKLHCSFLFLRMCFVFLKIGKIM